MPQNDTSTPSGHLVVMADGAVTATITIPVCAVSGSFAVAPGSPALIDICPAAIHTSPRPGDPDVATNTEIMVTVAANPAPPLHVVVKATNPAQGSDDAYLALAQHGLGSSYRAVCMEGFGFGRARFTAIADQDATTLSFDDCAGNPESVTFDTAETAQLLCANASGDCTGIEVSSTGSEPFGLVSGSTRAMIPTTAATNRETLLEMLPPVDWPGSEYLLAETNKKQAPPTNGDLYRIVAVETVTITALEAAGTGVVNTPLFSASPCSTATPFSLAAGEWCDILIGTATNGEHHGGRIAGTGRFYVAQYTRSFAETGSGDPSMMLVVPSDKFRCAHRFFSFTGFDYDPLDTLYVNGSYVSIVAPTAIIGQVQLDSTPLASIVDCDPFEALPSSTFSWTRCRLRNPCKAPFGCETNPLPPGCPAGCPLGEEHTATASEPIAVYVYGQKRLGGAYAYPAGYAR